jgi:hypothetical protein
VHAAPISIPWGAETSTPGGTIYPSPFQANTLVSIDGMGYFRSIDNSSPVTMLLSIELDGEWRTIFSATTTSFARDNTNWLSAIISDLQFPLGEITAISLFADTVAYTVFRDMRSPDTYFKFDALPPVPLPAALPLLMSAKTHDGDDI